MTKTHVAVFVILAGTCTVKVIADSTDQLTVLTTVGFLTGAADGCKVAARESIALSSGMASAIDAGDYGTPSQAHVLFNNARQRGISDAMSKSVDCAKIEDSVKRYALMLLR